MVVSRKRRPFQSSTCGTTRTMPRGAGANDASTLTISLHSSRIGPPSCSRCYTIQKPNTSSSRLEGLRCALVQSLQNSQFNFGSWRAAINRKQQPKTPVKIKHRQRLIPELMQTSAQTRFRIISPMLTILLFVHEPPATPHLIFIDLEEDYRTKRMTSLHKSPHNTLLFPIPTAKSRQQ